MEGSGHQPSRPDRSWRRLALTAVLVLMWALWISSPVVAGTCTTPGTHDSIQEAVLDSTCTSVDLSATTYDESIDITRSFVINGPGGGGAIIEGSATVRGNGTVATFNDLTVQNGCTPDAVQAGAGAELNGTNFIAQSNTTLPCPEILFIFNDGFETGDTSFWSTTLN